jgi:putative DNA primase/helicase
MSAQARVDFEVIANLALSQSRSLIPQWLPNGKLHGAEYRCGGLDGSPGESFAVNLNKGMWSDFATGDKGGDLVSLYAALHRMSQIDAARELSDHLLGSNETRPGVSAPPTPRVVAKSDWEPIIPVPEDAPPPPDEHYKHGRPAHIARYLMRDGCLIGYIYRCDTENGKEVYPLTYCQNAAGRREWRWLSFPKPRSLYGAETLTQGGRVLLVEGEPKRDAAWRLVGDALTVVAWPGGAKAVPYADWSMLAGRDVVIWPDADPAGAEAAAQITIQLRHHGATVTTVKLPADAPKGWDLADAEREGWSGENVLEYIDPPVQNEFYTAPTTEIEHFDFAPLGHDRGRFYFFTSGGGQVRDFSARDLQSVGSLCELAPLRYWEMNHPGKGDAGFNVRSSGDALVRACYRAGIYDAERLRGRGAWLDEGRTVLHIGDKLIVNGVETDLASMRSKFIYEQGRRLSLAIGDEQLPSERAARLMDLCMAAPWEDSQSMGRLLAGWLVIAPVCGAMPWRPHIWVTGEAGSGKTWIVDNLIRPVVGDIGLPVASKTSEAGVRGDLGLDARPVIFDEFESQNEHDRARVQQVLDLARQASSEDGAAIVKGTQTGGSRRYRIRSCFAFSSINLGLQQAADESRTVVLTVSPSGDQEIRRTDFQALLKLHAEVMTLDFRPALLARTLSLLPTIRANAEVFASAIARAGVSRRTGDTIGVLLAGAWSLRSRKIATAEEADEFVSTKAWVKNAVGRSEADPEWRRAIDFLVQVPLRTPIANRNTHQDTPIGELISIVTWAYDNPIVAHDEAVAVLARAGIRIEDGEVLIANSSETIRRAFSQTPWASSWSATLARTPGSEKLQKATRFASLVSKGLKMSLRSIIGDDA